MCFMSVARSLLKAGKLEFGSTILTVVEPPRDYIDDDVDDNVAGAGNNVVRVSSIPRSMSLEMLKTFLESDKIGAGPIYDIQYTDGDNDSVLVYFQRADGRSDVNSHLFVAAWHALFFKYTIGSEIFGFTMGFHEELCIIGVVAMSSGA